jgi:hypothetical protein
MSLMPWFDAWRFGAQAQHVVMLRMMRFWLRDASAGAEATRMVGEKMAASAEAQVAAATALIKGQSAKTALKRATTPYRRRVRANYKRLTK